MTPDGPKPNGGLKPLFAIFAVGISLAGLMYTMNSVTSDDLREHRQLTVHPKATHVDDFQRHTELPAHQGAEAMLRGIKDEIVHLREDIRELRLHCRCNGSGQK